MIAMIGSREEYIQMVEAIALHLEGKTPLLVVESYSIWEPPVPTILDMADMIHNVTTASKPVRSPYDKGGRPKNKGRSIHALMCLLQHENPPIK